MKRLLTWMHWLNHRGKPDWSEIGIDILILIILGLGIYIGILFK